MPNTKHDASIIDGRALAGALLAQISDEVAALKKKPGLAVVLVGDDPASHVYVSNKIKACQKAGIASFEHRLPAGTKQDEVYALIQTLNADPAVHGILLQLPVPPPLDGQALTQAIDPAKDVDGLTVSNIGKLAAGLPGLVPCTPQGAMLLIKSANQNLAGKHAVVIGRSLLFGKPMAQLLLAENCTVTQAHSHTKNLAEISRQADILVAAAGKPRLVKSDWIKPGAIVIDVGINSPPSSNSPPPAGGNKGGLCGDVDFEGALNIAGAITPVPGGVGPMTIACLLKNTLQAAKNQ